MTKRPVDSDATWVVETRLAFTELDRGKDYILLLEGWCRAFEEKTRITEESLFYWEKNQGYWGEI